MRVAGITASTLAAVLLASAPATAASRPAAALSLTGTHRAAMPAPQGNALAGSGFYGVFIVALVVAVVVIIVTVDGSEDSDSN